MGKVFMIDDDESIRHKYKERFANSDLELIEADDALSATEVLMREKSNIDLILLDLQLPEIDGRAIYDIIEDYASNIPVIVTSVLPIEDQKLRIPRATDYFNKSEGSRVLISKIKKLLG